jgi:replicative DNA helicase
MGTLVLSKFIQDKSTKSYIESHISRDLFKEAEWQTFDFVNQHVVKYGELPNEETLKNHTGFEVLDTPEPLQYYIDELYKRHVSIEVKDTVAEVHRHLSNTDNLDPYEALKVMTERVGVMNLQAHGDKLRDFRTAEGPVIQEYYRNAKHNKSQGVFLGFPTIDNMMNGLQGGELTVYVGRPALGKTFFTLYSAHHQWKSGLVPMYVTLEMKSKLIFERLAAITSKRSLGRLKLGLLTKPGIDHVKKVLHDNRSVKNPFWVMDGGLSTTPSEIKLMAQLVKPDCIIVDGAYNLKAEKNINIKWEKVAYLTECLKELSDSLNIPVVASFQFNRDAAKKKDVDNIGLEDIAHSDVIGQMASLVLGLFEEESVETLKQRTIHVLKGRNGESGRFNTRWNFMAMDFSEIPKEEINEYSFL